MVSNVGIPSLAHDQRLVKIIPPRDNSRDALAVETLLSALADEDPFALELAATPNERMILVRGQSAVVERVLSQLRSAYPQCGFADLPPKRDPLLPQAPARRACELRLREASHLPIRTFVSRPGRLSGDDFSRGADPMIGVLAAMDGLASHEACGAQFILKPMPPDWSKYWRGAQHDVGERAKLTPSGLGITLLGALGPACIGFGALLIALAAAASSSLAFWLFAFSLIVVGAFMLFARFRIASPPDPVLVTQKTNSPAFRVWVRLFVFAATDQNAETRMRQLLSAFSAYNLPGGNGFVQAPLPDSVQPQALDESSDPLLRRLPGQQQPVLNAAEVAALWHLPHGEAGMQGLAIGGSKQLAPLPEQVSEGVLVGQANRQGYALDVRLSRSSLRGNIGLIAKTQSGKSNLMALIASDVIASDPEAAVIIVDPHRTLAQLVAANLPPSRAAHAVYWSLADTGRPFGLNLLDRLSSYSTSDKVVSDVIETMKNVWPDNWGPRMEDYLRWPLLTLARGNEAMLRDWRFAEWRLEATSALARLQASLAQGRLNHGALDSAHQVLAHFRGLERPYRFSTGKLYDKFKQFYLDYDAAQRSFQSGAARGLDGVSQTLRALHVQLQAESQHKNRPPSGLSARVFRPRDGKQSISQFTLLDVNRLHMSAVFQNTVLLALPDDEAWTIKDWWRDYSDLMKTNQRLLMDIITPVKTKIDRFHASGVARRIFGQPSTTIDLPRLIDEGGVLILDLAAGVVGQDTAALVGSLVLNWVASIIFARQQIDGGRTTDDGRPADRHPSDQQSSDGHRPLSVVRPSSSVIRRVFIVVDEFQSMPGADYAFMLSELGKYGAELMMGTQSLEVLQQVNAKTAAAWLDNVNTLFVFRCGADDAQTLAAELATGAPDRLTVTAEDIVGLADYACFVRVRDASRTPRVFHLQTRQAEDGDAAIAEQVFQRSRQDYGRDATEVDRWLYDSHRWIQKLKAVTEQKDQQKSQPTQQESSQNTNAPDRAIESDEDAGTASDTGDGQVVLH